MMIREVSRMQGSNSVEDSKNRKHLGTMRTTARLWSWSRHIPQLRMTKFKGR